MAMQTYRKQVQVKLLNAASCISQVSKMSLRFFNDNLSDSAKVPHTGHTQY